MREYKCLLKQKYSIKEYQIVPIRHEDRYDIMQWRNDQIYHLRQSNHLDKESQDLYFNNVIANLFDKENPDQILFSFLENEKCIGYGGLVHINWVDKNAEISFVLNTELESFFFKKLWSVFLNLIEEVSFINLKLHKIYTYAYDLRPKLFDILELHGYSNEAILKNHVMFQNKYINILIHSKFNKLH